MFVTFSTCREKENEAIKLRREISNPSSRILKETVPRQKDDIEKMREELERLRNRNFDLEEEVRDLKGDE